MRSALTLGLLLAAAWPLRTSVAQQAQVAERPVPFFDARTHKPEYVGPLDQRADTDELSEIRIGYFGPADPHDPLYGDLWRAAQAALDDANERGGYHGKPYRLLPAWSDNPWGSGVKQLTQLVYRDRVWAIVGGMDGPTTHLAEQVVVKARLALVSPVSTDKTVNLTNVSWMFSLAPNDQRVAEVLIEELARGTRDRRRALITTNDHDAFLCTREVRRALTMRQIAVSHQFEYQPQSAAVAQLVHQCLAGKPDELLIIANAQDSVHLVRAVRQAGFAGRIYGGPACGRASFVREIADLAGELVFPRLDEAASEPATPGDPALAANRATTAAHSDYAARHMYDAVHIVITAIEKAGLSRVEIARAIRDQSPFAGASGRIEWDAPGGNMRRPTLATLVQGRVVPWGVSPQP